MFDPKNAAMIEASRRHAMVCYPEEAVGAVTPNGYEPLRNVHPDPGRFFDCHEELAPILQAGDLRALIHSHPNGPFGPSETDMAQQLAMAIPWGITVCDGTASADPWFWGDGIPTPPLEGRSFRHGPSGSDGKGDCFALIRDWYRIERGVHLADWPRSDEWWKAGRDFYRTNYREWGFEPINGDTARRGDVWFMQILSNVPNHGAIYLGEGKILHHLPSRLSRVEPAINWRRQVCEQVRYAG